MLRSGWLVGRVFLGGGGLAEGSDERVGEAGRSQQALLLAVHACCLVGSYLELYLSNGAKNRRLLG